MFEIAGGIALFAIGAIALLNSGTVLRVLFQAIAGIALLLVGFALMIIY